MLDIISCARRVRLLPLSAVMKSQSARSASTGSQDRRGKSGRPWPSPGGALRIWERVLDSVETRNLDAIVGMSLTSGIAGRAGPAQSSTGPILTGRRTGPMFHRAGWDRPFVPPGRPPPAGGPNAPPGRSEGPKLTQDRWANQTGRGARFGVVYRQPCPGWQSSPQSQSNRTDRGVTVRPSDTRRFRIICSRSSCRLVLNGNRETGAGSRRLAAAASWMRKSNSSWSRPVQVSCICSRNGGGRNPVARNRFTVRSAWGYGLDRLGFFLGCHS